MGSPRRSDRNCRPPRRRIIVDGTLDQQRSRMQSVRCQQKQRAPATAVPVRIGEDDVWACRQFMESLQCARRLWMTRRPTSVEPVRISLDMWVGADRLATMRPPARIFKTPGAPARRQTSPNSVVSEVQRRLITTVFRPGRPSSTCKETGSSRRDAAHTPYGSRRVSRLDLDWRRNRLCSKHSNVTVHTSK